MIQELTRFVSDGFERAKAGDALNVFNAVVPYHLDGSLPLRSHYPFGWIIYYALHQSPAHDIEPRKRMLARYLALQLQKPHKLHSMILTEAIRLYKDARDAAFNQRPEDTVRFSIVKFASLWDLRNLRPGDWKRKEHEGKPISSTAEKLITLYVDELSETASPAPAQFMEVMERALREFPDSFNLLAQRAAIHAASGERAEAAALLRKAILSAPGKFFLWSRLASLHSPDDNLRLHIALLFKALSAPGPEQFKGKIRLALAQAWIHGGMHPQALWELDRIKSVYEANGWHLSPRHAAARAKIPEGTAPEDPARFYKKVEHLADEEVYNSLPPVDVTKTYHKNPSPGNQEKRGYGPQPVAWRVTDAEGRNYWLQPHRFRLQADLPLGTPLRIRLYNGKPVKAELM